MKYAFLLFFQMLALSISAQDAYQLAPPVLKYNSIFFSDESVLEIKFAQSETEVHYTINNSEPTQHDPVYKNPIIIKNNFTTVKAKAFGKGFIPSVTTMVTFIKSGLMIQSAVSTPPNNKYPGNGINALIDNKGGINQLTSNTWMGFNDDSVTIVISLIKEQTVSTVLLNFLQNESSWVFLPQEIKVNWFDSKSNSFKYFGSEHYDAANETTGSSCKFKVISSTNKIETSKISLTLLPVKKMPDWHRAKGEHAWMFIDELKLY